jgi:predicted phage tail protein
MARITTVTHPDGTTTSIVTRSSGCGCSGCFTWVLVVFVLTAPAYYAEHGEWPLGWAGAVMAYVVLAVAATLGVAAARHRTVR